MDSFKRDFQFIVRRLFILLPSQLAYHCVSSVLEELLSDGYVSGEEYSNLSRLNDAYLEILGG